MVWEIMSFGQRPYWDWDNFRVGIFMSNSSLFVLFVFILYWRMHVHDFNEGKFGMKQDSRQSFTHTTAWFEVTGPSRTAVDQTCKFTDCNLC